MSIPKVSDSAGCFPVFRSNCMSVCCSKGSRNSQDTISTSKTKASVCSGFWRWLCCLKPLKEDSNHPPDWKRSTSELPEMTVSSYDVVNVTNPIYGKEKEIEASRKKPETK